MFLIAQNPLKVMNYVSDISKFSFSLTLKVCFSLYLLSTILDYFKIKL